MSIRDCAVIAIDGTHASGKTTLIHALTAHYRRHGINVAAMSEPARSSPFMEEIVIHHRSTCLPRTCSTNCVLQQQLKRTLCRPI